MKKRSNITKPVKKKAKGKKREKKNNKPPKQVNLQLLTPKSIPLPFIKICLKRDSIEQGSINKKGQLHLILPLSLKDPSFPFLPQTSIYCARKSRPNNSGKTFQIIDPLT